MTFLVVEPAVIPLSYHDVLLVAEFGVKPRSTVAYFLGLLDASANIIPILAPVSVSEYKFPVTVILYSRPAVAVHVNDSPVTSINDDELELLSDPTTTTGGATRPPCKPC